MRSDAAANTDMKARQRDAFIRTHIGLARDQCAKWETAVPPPGETLPSAPKLHELASLPSCSRAT